VRRILIELDASDEPAWAYLDYQHAHILDTMKTQFKKAAEQAQGEGASGWKRLRI
jgi:exocyst complex component 2